jgi:hypothetical protein
MVRVVLHYVGSHTAPPTFVQYLLFLFLKCKKKEKYPNRGVNYGSFMFFLQIAGSK